MTAVSVENEGVKVVFKATWMKVVIVQGNSDESGKC